MNNTTRTLVAIVALLVFLGLNAFYTVDQRELAVEFRFGQIIRTDIEPGLHWKWPLIDRVRFFDGRILTLDNQPERFLTVEKKNLMVDFFVKWRISDVARFYRATAGSEQIAVNRLSEIIKNGLRDEFGKRTLQEVVSGERSEIMQDATSNANKMVQDFGVTIVDVRVKRIDLPDAVSGKVFERMEAERAQAASKIRAEGSQDAEQTRADADRQRTVILADAYAKAQKLRGEGDATASEIYAKAYEKDPDFFAFYRSLQAYKQALPGKGDVLVLDPDSEFFKYFKSAGGH